MSERLENSGPDRPLPAMDQRTALDSAHKLAKPWLARGYRFGGLFRYRDANAREPYARLLLRHPDSGQTDSLHLVPAPGGYARVPGAPTGLPPYYPPSLPANRSSTAIVVEDEGVADQLAERGIITLAGGAETDWTTLEGRHALVWPERDGPPTGVAAAMSRARATVEIMDTGFGPADWLARQGAAVPAPVLLAKLLSLPRTAPQDRRQPRQPLEGDPDRAEPMAGLLASRRGTRGARDFLRTALGESVRPAGEILAEARRAGFSQRTVQAASAQIGVVRWNEGMRGGWMWRVPEGARRR